MPTAAISSHITWQAEPWLQTSHHTKTGMHALCTATYRTRAGPIAPSPPAATPGMELVGSRCVLTGSVLHLLKGETLAGVTELTLAHLPYCEVRGHS